MPANDIHRINPPASKYQSHAYRTLGGNMDRY